MKLPFTALFTDKRAEYSGDTQKEAMVKTWKVKTRVCIVILKNLEQVHFGRSGRAKQSHNKVNKYVFPDVDEDDKEYSRDGK